MNRGYLGGIALALAWPVVQMLVFVARFGRLPEGGLRSGFIFFPMSLLTAIVFVVLWRGAITRPRRIGIVVGYLVASPIALVGSLVSGLLLPPVWGTLLYGGVPLILGMGIGALVGKHWPRKRSA